MSLPIPITKNASPIIQLLKTVPISSPIKGKSQTIPIKVTRIADSFAIFTSFFMLSKGKNYLNNFLFWET